jgi:hypothetical protein
MMFYTKRLEEAPKKALTTLLQEEEPVLSPTYHHHQRSLNSHLQKFWCKICLRRVVSPLYVYDNKSYYNNNNTTVVSSCRDCYIVCKLREREKEREGGT